MSASLRSRKRTRTAARSSPTKPVAAQTTATAVWNTTVRPRMACNCSTARSCVPGLPIGRPARSATWSEPITSACGKRAATACALASASRRASASGDSPARGASSTSGAAVSKGSRRRSSSSRR